jgi:SAM-dependent methyltransferase
MNQWLEMSKRWNEWGSPLKPCPEDVAMFKSQIVPNSKILLLGVTPALFPLANIAIDNNPEIVKLHPNYSMVGDWADLPFESAFDALIGDGCLTVFQGAPELFFQQAKKALKLKGRLILRLFISPESKESLQTIFAQKEKIGFHAFKWRVAHALANPYLSVQKLRETILPIWNHPTLEVYQDSPLIYYFPKLSELPKWDHIQWGKGYELAERCPVITWLTNSSNFPRGNSFT